MELTRENIIKGRDNQGNEIEVGTTSIDAFYEEAAPAYMTKGYHRVRITNYEVVPSKTVTTRTSVYTTKQYILIDLLDVNNGETHQTKLYSKFVPYFMDQIAAQTENEISGMKLSAILNYLGRNSFDIWLTFSKDFGLQVNYREPRN